MPVKRERGKPGQGAGNGKGFPAESISGAAAASSRPGWRRLALVALALALLVGATGCIKPDKTVEAPTENPTMLPFETITPSPSPDPYPTGQVDGTGGVVDGGTIVVTAAPTVYVAATQVITPSPSPTPMRTPAPTPTPKPTDDGMLRFGSTGQAVRQVQQRLKELGYYTGSVDGDFGSATESAVRAFQKANGLTVDGVVGKNTLTKLNSSTAKSKTASSRNATARPQPKSYTPSTPGKYRYLQLGSSGSDVTKLQNRLKELGYYSGKVTGIFDEATEAAVLAFQLRNGCWADGVAGEDTQTELYKSTALMNNK